MIKRLFGFTLLLVTIGCANVEDQTAIETEEKIQVVCTTSMLTDWMQELATEEIEVIPLLKKGMDPHVYKPSKKDLDVLRSADVIIYHGLHLEGKIIEVLEHMDDALVIDASSDFPDSLIIRDPNFPASTDPHYWFDLDLVNRSLQTMVEGIGSAYPQLQEALNSQRASYSASLAEVGDSVQKIIETIPAELRIVITTHDALSYFARDFGLEVNTLQGASTVSEFGLKEITELVDFICENKIPAIFLENIVSPQAMESVQRGCQAKGFEVELGPELLSDSLGAEEDQDTYAEMLLFNARTLAAYLN